MEATTRVLHRLEEHRSHGVGPFELDGLGDAVGAVAAKELFVMRVFGRGPVEVRVRRAEAAGGQRLERSLERRDAGDRQRALRGAVVGDGSRNHLVLTGFSGQLEVLLGQFPGTLDGLAAAGREEHPVQVARCVVGHPLGQLDGRRRGVRPQREERQLLGLLGRGLGKLLAAVAYLYDEEAGQAIDVALALVVENSDALAAGDDGRCDALAVPGEVSPQVAVCFAC